MDLKLLLQATARIYLRALSGAWRGFFRNYWVLALHFAYLVLCALILPIAALFGPLAGGFIVGILLSLMVSNYLVCVAVAVEQERVSLAELKSKTWPLFSSVIGVFFAFFLIDLLSDALFAGPGQVWLRLSVQLLIAVLFNPLPEVIYQRSGGALQLLGESFEFVQENFLEWVFPALLLGLVFWLLNPVKAVSLALLLTLTNPLRLIQLVVLQFNSPQIWLQSAPLLLAVLALSYFVFIFRGILFEELASSTRRKRIYQERHRP